jgi:hypothetical protein
MPDCTKIGRLAFRQEGDLWCAYYAMPDTMRDALLLGALHMRFATQPATKLTFMHLMRGVVADIIEEATGARPQWKDPIAAPEHERSKS